jgi:hypothetical protein
MGRISASNPGLHDAKQGACRELSETDRLPVDLDVRRSENAVDEDADLVMAARRDAGVV